MSATAEHEHTGRIIRDEVRIAASPEDVYRAWSDPASVTGWFLGRMEGRMEPGEEITWYWSDDGPGMRHRVLVAEPPRRLVTRMDLPRGPSDLEITIEEDGPHSIVRLTQSGLGEGPEWDDECEAMLSGWMIALAILKFFAERYLGRRRREIVILADAPFDREEALELQRSEAGLARWLTRSGAPGQTTGEPVRLVLPDGRALTGSVLRATAQETAWSWDEIEGVLEIKAFRGARWGSKVGVRVSSWMKDATDLVDVEGLLTTAVEKLVALLADGTT
jgi:uncharacterized protein YndB with AHSA1/START domain